MIINIKSRVCWASYPNDLAYLKRGIRSTRGTIIKNYKTDKLIDIF